MSDRPPSTRLVATKSIRIARLAINEKIEVDAKGPTSFVPGSSTGRGHGTGVCPEPA